jgi:hypothetical protein
MSERRIGGDEDERARRKKVRRALADARTTQPYESHGPPAAGARVTSAHLLVALAVGVGIGGLGAYAVTGGGRAAEAGPSAAEAAGPTLGPRADPSAAAPPAGNADKFGRPPGDEHFGHDHPVQQGAAPGAAPPPAPGPDGKDQFGRAPGHEHFGHTHP